MDTIFMCNLIIKINKYTALFIHVKQSFISFKIFQIVPSPPLREQLFLHSTEKQPLSEEDQEPMKDLKDFNVHNVQCTVFPYFGNIHILARVF